MFKRFSFVAAVVVTMAMGAVAQNTPRQSNITGMQVLGQAVAAEFGRWEAPVLTQVAATGSRTVSVEGSAFNVQQGTGFTPLSTAIPIRIDDGPNSETVTPSAVSCSRGSGICTFTATFVNTHKNNYKIKSATNGLQEAIEFMHQRGGQVLVTSDWVGTTNMITGANGYTNVSILDTRSGGNYWYAWDGNDYAITFGFASSGSTVPTAVATAQRFNNIRYCNQFPGATAGAKIAACIADLPSTGGVADATGLEGAQSITSDPFSGVTKPVRLLLGSATYTLTVEINPTASYTWIDCTGTTLKAATVGQNIIHWSLERGGIGGNCILDGNNVATTTGLRVGPSSESGTAVRTVNSFNNFYGLRIQNTTEGIVLTTGPTVAASQSDTSYNAFFGTTLLDNIRGIWLKQHPSDITAASPDTNDFYATKCYSTGARTNTCVHIDAGGTNRFFGLHSINMNNGTSPNNPPVAYYIRGAAPTSPTNNDSNYVYGLRSETDTQCFKVSSSSGNFNGLVGASGCTNAKISDAGNRTVITGSPYTDKNGLWYSYTDATGIVTLNPAFGTTIAPLAGPVVIDAVGAFNVTSEDQIRLESTLTSGNSVVVAVPAGAQNGVYVFKASTAGTTDPVLRLDNGFAGGTQVFLVDASGNVTAAGLTLSNVLATTPGTWPTDFPACGAGQEGYLKAVANSNVGTFGTAITGTGAFKGLAYCDGTSYKFR